MQDNFEDAREIIDLQEELLKWKRGIDELLKTTGIGSSSDDSAKEDDNEEIEELEELEGIDEDSTCNGYTEHSENELNGNPFVDNLVVAGLEDATVTFMHPEGFSIGNEYYSAHTWRDIIVKLSGVLYAINPYIINSMIDENTQKGKKGLFAYDKTKHRRSKKIQGVDIWVEVNMSAKDIKKSMLRLLQLYKIPADSVKLYFKKGL